MSDNQGITPEHLRNLGNINPTHTDDTWLDEAFEKNLPTYAIDAKYLSRLKDTITTHTTALVAQAVIAALEKLLEQQDTCYDCVHEDENFEWVPFVPVSAIKELIEQPEERG